VHQSQKTGSRGAKNRFRSKVGAGLQTRGGGQEMKIKGPAPDAGPRREGSRDVSCDAEDLGGPPAMVVGGVLPVPTCHSKKPPRNVGAKRAPEIASPKKFYVTRKPNKWHTKDRWGITFSRIRGGESGVFVSCALRGGKQ